MLPAVALIAVIGLFLALPGAINQSIALWERWQARRAGSAMGAEPRQPRGLSLFIFNLIGVCLLFLAAYKTWIEPLPVKPQLGFNSGWPDAIKCMVVLPDGVGRSPLIFYYQGITVARRPFGDTARYFLVGGYNDKQGYAAHELWFTPEHQLIRVETGRQTIVVGDDFKRHIAKEQLDELGQRYLDTFLVDAVECGGNTIDAIANARNAFYFAER